MGGYLSHPIGCRCSACEEWRRQFSPAQGAAELATRQAYQRAQRDQYHLRSRREEIEATIPDYPKITREITKLLP